MTTIEAPEWKRWVPSVPVLCAWGILLAMFAWTYLGTLQWLWSKWLHEPDYGHGFFVPIFSLFLLWYRSDMVASAPLKGLWWAALPLFLLSGLIRWAAIYFNFSIDHYSLFPLLLGLTLLLGGWRGLHWAWPSIFFLVFMIPLPGAMAILLGRHLQTIATAASIYVIQTLGIAAVAQGNQIQLAAQTLEVADACSGIRMLMLFFAVCVGAALVMRRPLWEKAVIVVSAVPIAIISNVARITVTAIISDLFGETCANFVHDYAGWAMMPLAMAILWGEVLLISKLLYEPPSEVLLTLEDTSAVAR